MVLKKFELVKDTAITNGCYLLFASGDVFSTTVEIGRLAGDTLIQDSLTIRSDLFGEVDAALSFIRKHLNRSYIITGDKQREERWDYPLEALREIVVNMIVHRDYMSSSDSMIRIFDDRIEFFNPGRLMAVPGNVFQNHPENHPESHPENINKGPNPRYPSGKSKDHPRRDSAIVGEKSKYHQRPSGQAQI